VTRALAGLLFAACGGHPQAHDAPAAPPDTPGPDAPDLACANPVRGTTVAFRKVLQIPLDASSPVQVLVTSPPNDLRLFVVDRDGAIRIVKDDQVVGTFIDLDDDAGGPVITTANSSAEQGLLGLAFHPDYARNRTFFVYYTRAELADTVNRTRDVVARCTASAADPDKADPTCTEVLAIPDFATNHNGGMIEFGPDGYLYIGTGDGGSGGDPHNNGQALADTPATNTIALLGKLLRIDVDHQDPGKQYAIPLDNPFGTEIYAYGLRNPWRWSFDRATGDVWIGDVGQNAIEELDYVPAGKLAGANFGWSMFEGSACFKPPCDATGVVMPVDERLHSDGWTSIIGGQVYRGTCYPDLAGTYFYMDLQRRSAATARVAADGSVAIADITAGVPRSSSIHEDARGEIWVTDLSGNLWHLEAGP
jgi:glucose/arabinose dehydrogenase